MRMFDWYREAAPAERRTFWGCFCGWTLDSFDNQVLAFLLPTLHGGVAFFQARGGFDCNFVFARRRDWRVGFGNSKRSPRTRTRLDRLDHLVHGVQHHCRVYELVSPVAGRARFAGFGVRRRVGRRGSADGGGHQSGSSGESPRPGSERVLCWLGARRRGHGCASGVSAFIDCVEVGLLGRRDSCAYRAADPAIYSRAGNVPRNEKGDRRCDCGDVALIVSKGCPALESSRRASGYRAASKQLRHHDLVTYDAGSGSPLARVDRCPDGDNDECRLVHRASELRIRQRLAWPSIHCDQCFVSAPCSYGLLPVHSNGRVDIGSVGASRWHEP